MKPFAVAPYAARSVLRRKLGTASALIGLLFGVALVSAPWIALDSTMRSFANSYLGRVSVDLAAWGSESNAADAAAAARNVPNVLVAEPIVLMPLDLNISGSTSPVETLWIEPTFASTLGRMGITWTNDPGPGGVVVHDSFQSAGIDIGGTVALERWYYGALGLEVFVATRRVDGFYSTTPGRDVSMTLAFLPVSDLERAESEFNVTAGTLEANLLIWMDRAALVDPYDPEGTAARVLRQRSLLNDALEPFRFSIPDRYSDSGVVGGWSLYAAVEGFASQARFLRLWFLPFTIPSVAMAVLLSRVGYDIGLGGRRRELSVLRARGVSVRGVRGFLLVEMTVVSLLAAVLGLGLALLLSRILLTLPLFAPSSFGASPSVPAAELVVSPVSLAFVIGFAWFLGWLSSRRVFKIASSRNIVSGFRAYHAEEVSLPYLASRDFLLLTIGAGGLLLLVASAFAGAASDQASWLGIPTLVLAPIAPILLTIGVVRYLTRGTTRAYRALCRLLKAPLKDVEHLVDKNLARAPRRASNIAMIVTFAVAFLVAVPILTGSSETFLYEQARLRTPSDIVVDASAVSGSANRSTSDEVRAIPGVAMVTPILKARADFGAAFFFDASSYLGTVPWLEPRYIGGTDPRQLMADLADGGSVAVNPEYQRMTGLRLGDPVRIAVLSSQEGRVVFNVTGQISALVPSIPGMDVGPTPQAYANLSMLPAEVEGEVGGAWTYLIRLSSGTDPAAVVESLRSLFGPAVSVLTLADTLRADDVASVRAGTFMYLATQSQMAAVLMVVGIGLLVFSAASARRDELVTLVARGLPRNKVARLVMAEGWIVALLGIMLGTFAGLLTAASVLILASTRLPFAMPLVVPWTVVIPLLLVTAGVWVAAYLGALSIARMDVARVLKMRGG